MLVSISRVQILDEIPQKFIQVWRIQHDKLMIDSEPLMGIGGQEIVSCSEFIRGYFSIFQAIGNFQIIAIAFAIAYTISGNCRNCKYTPAG